MTHLASARCLFEIRWLSKEKHQELFADVLHHGNPWFGLFAIGEFAGEEKHYFDWLTGTPAARVIVDSLVGTTEREDFGATLEKLEGCLTTIEILINNLLTANEIVYISLAEFSKCANYLALNMESVTQQTSKIRNSEDFNSVYRQLYMKIIEVMTSPN